MVSLVRLTPSEIFNFSWVTCNWRKFTSLSVPSTLLSLTYRRHRSSFHFALHKYNFHQSRNVGNFFILLLAIYFAYSSYRTIRGLMKRTATSWEHCCLQVLTTTTVWAWASTQTMKSQHRQSCWPSFSLPSWKRIMQMRLSIANWVRWSVIRVIVIFQAL